MKSRKERTIFLSRLPPKELPFNGKQRKCEFFLEFEMNEVRTFWREDSLVVRRGAARGDPPPRAPITAAGAAATGSGRVPGIDQGSPGHPLGHDDERTEGIRCFVGQIIPFGTVVFAICLWFHLRLELVTG